MRNTQQQKQPKATANTRSLTVYYSYRCNRRIPVIRIGGDYLHNMGFSIGDTITITINYNQ